MIYYCWGCRKSGFTKVEEMICLMNSVCSGANCWTQRVRLNICKRLSRDSDVESPLSDWSNYYFPTILSHFKFQSNTKITESIFDNYLWIIILLNIQPIISLVKILYYFVIQYWAMNLAYLVWFKLISGNSLIE